MSDSDMVPTLLGIVTPSSKFGSDQEWELTIRFANEHCHDNLAEIIFANSPVSTEPWKVGALIDHLVWNISDESVERMIRTVESWMCGDNPRKISYALAVDYVFPFRDSQQMIAVLTDVKSRWPEFSERCDELISRRKRQ
jgi:hypothetical protein